MALNFLFQGMSYTIDIQEGPEESFPLVGQTPEQSDHCYSPSGSFGLHLLQPDGHRSDQEQQAQQMAGYGTGSQTFPTGIAFSGGGIRSAAFCSGVLRWMLKNNQRMDYLSCVSGGGYTGAAFLSWMHRKGPDTEKWQDKFFEKMHENAGYLCNFQKPRSAILDPIFFIFFLSLLCWFCRVCSGFPTHFRWPKQLTSCVETSCVRAVAVMSPAINQLLIQRSQKAPTC